MADIARYAANSDRRTERRRECRAAESSEQRETRLARRRVADRATCSLSLVSQASRIFLVSMRVREGGGGKEGKIRLVTNCVILEPAAWKYRDYVLDKGDSSGYC